MTNLAMAHDALRRPIALSIGALLVLATTTHATSATDANAPAPAPAPLRGEADTVSPGPGDGPSATWHACGDGWECTMVTVAWDPADPSLGEVDIPVVRRPADDPARRLGALVYNPGGPGVPGSALTMGLAPVFPEPILERFDLVSFDPRGTGSAGRVDCGTDVGALFALDQTSGPGGTAAAGWEALATACRSALGGRLPSVSTARTADDVEAIRRVLDVEAIDWFGTSYGTRLGLEYLRRFPAHVRTLVLDGSMDPDAALDQQARDMAAAAEPAVERLLTVCGHQDPCPLGGDPLRAYDALALRLAQTPLTSSAGPDVGLVALQVAAQAAAALPVFTAGPFIEAVAAARDGDGGPLLALATAVDDGGQTTFDAQVAILCNDEAIHPDATAAAMLASELAAAAPRTGLGVAATWGVVCQGWEPAVAPVVAFDLATTVPVLVIGSTGDPSTSYSWSKRMAEAVTGARLLTREGDGHTALFNTFLAGCTGAAVAAFVVDPVTAAVPATCSD